MQKSLSLLEARRYLNLTQVQIAEMLDITAEYVSMIEKEKKTPSKKLLNKLGFLTQTAQAPPRAGQESCPVCAEKAAKIVELERERDFLRDQVSGLVSALAAKPTVCASAPRACGADCGAGEKTEKRKEA